MVVCGNSFNDPYLYDDASHGIKRSYYMTDQNPNFAEPIRHRPRLDHSSSAVSLHGSQYRDDLGADGSLYSQHYYGSDYGGGHIHHLMEMIIHMDGAITIRLNDIGFGTMKHIYGIIVVRRATLGKEGKLEYYENEVVQMENMSRQEFVAHLRRRSSGFSRDISMYRGVTRFIRNSFNVQNIVLYEVAAFGDDILFLLLSRI